jgi:hypothetical protein
MWDILKKIWDTILFWRKSDDKPAPEPEPDIYGDELDVSAIRIRGIDWSGWPAKYDLSVKPGGGGVYLEQQLTSELDSIDDNVGSCWFICRQNGAQWEANRWDQIRGGQKKRDFPWNPPHPKEGESYATAKRHQEIYLCVTSMARDHKRNGDVRTKIARLQ